MNVKKMLAAVGYWILVIIVVASAVTYCIAHAARVSEVGSWAKPGENPFRGSVWTAVMSYKHIPYADRVRLALRVQYDKPDDVAIIRKSGIEAMRDWSYAGGINDMHFGRNRVHKTVDMSAWPDDHTEAANVWCSGVWCIGAPIVCNNIFWTTRDQIPQQSARSLGAPRSVQQVPEPGVLGLTLLAVAAAIRMTGRRD